MSSDLLSSGGTDVDERLVAKAALDSAQEHLRSLCASHASTFVSVERRGAKLESLLKELQVSIAQVLENNVASSQEALEKDTLSQLSENHRLRRRTLLQHSSLLELLELPSLMDACVRSNLYQEALSIASFANTLERRQGNNNVVSKVVQQIRTRQVDLRRMLISRLKTFVTMPECLEIVTSLRRLNSIETENTSSFSNQNVELKLQLDFLEARDAWLDVCGKSNKGDGFLDVIEQYRARVFEIATQFNAIFHASSSSSTTTTTTTPLLNMWTTRRIHSFLNLLKQHNFVDSASLRDAWEASVFFATSMGRLGADFSPLLGKLFSEKMIALVTASWNEGLSTLSETLQICHDVGVAFPLVSSTIDTTTFNNTNMEDGQPPRVLMKLPPLARLVNSFLVGLNELRRCLFPCLFGDLRKHVDEFLVQTLVILEQHDRAVRAPGLRGEATQLRETSFQLLEMMQQVVDPYVRGALELALGNIRAAKVLLETEQAQEDNVEIPQQENEEEDDVEETEGVQEDKAPVTNDEPKEEDATPENDSNEIGNGGIAGTVTDASEDDAPAGGEGWDEDDAFDKF